MDKHAWNKVDKNSNKPSPRWGHTCCVIAEEIVFFGGYADSNYMNDLWSYDATTMKWTEVITTGLRPTQRSNCSMNYDQDSDRIVIFGGGGPNKQRFNTVNILDWKTKIWSEINPKENEEGPWERTYHIAELKYPYLMIFGGEGVTDMDDLWIFNFQTTRWTEVKMGKDEVRPCARRFHSSCIINNEIFIIAGCYGKYRCLSDVYSLDIKPLLQTGQTKELRWVQRKLKGSSFLSRWGHSSAVYDNKIYVFAGRFSNDLNDLLVIDVLNNSIKALKITGNPQEYPKPRRRHCAGFVGSCMIAFGGFNGQYFNDLHYINVFQLNNRIQMQTIQERQESFANKTQFTDAIIYSKDRTPLNIHTALLSKYFKSQSSLRHYLSDINNNYHEEELLSIIKTFYKGYGKIYQDQIHQKHEITLPQNLNRRHYVNQLLECDKNERNLLKLAVQSNEKCSDHVIELKYHEFKCFLENMTSHWGYEDTLMVNQNEIKVNKTLLSMQSTYFKNIFRSFENNQETRLDFLNCDQLIFQVLVNYLMMGVMVVPSDFSIEDWMKMAQVSDYLCLGIVKSICESQLCLRVNCNSLERLCQFGQEFEFKNLSLHCANFQIKTEESLQMMLKKCSESNVRQQNRKNAFSKLYNILRFDLLHSNKNMVQRKDVTLLKKGESQTNIEEKENNREYNNA